MQISKLEKENEKLKHKQHTNVDSQSGLISKKGLNTFEQAAEHRLLKKQQPLPQNSSDTSFRDTIKLHKNYDTSHFTLPQSM